ncbi:MAG: cytochrome c3 family protein [Armatimonadota bacterium]
MQETHRRFGIPPSRIWSIFLGVVVLGMMFGIMVMHPDTGQAEEKPDIIAATDTDTCLACHAEKVDAKHFQGSAHGRLGCQLCHIGVDRFPHPEKAVAQKPTCKTCHGIKTSAIAHSVHRQISKKDGQSFDCQSCHGKNPHEIGEVSQISQQQQVAPCQRCHRDVVTSMAGSVHGHPAKATAGSVPNCLSCHGNDPHTLTPAKKTGVVPFDSSCQTCHTDVAKLMAGSAHGQSAKEAANRLSCLACHGTNPHAVKLPGLNNAGRSALCVKCHADVAKAVTSSAHGGHAGVQDDKRRPDCVSCHGSNLHAVTPVVTITAPQKEASCKSCHSEVVKSLAGSVHGDSGIPAEKRPGCLSCHKGTAHNVNAPEKLDRLQVESACKSCHSNLAAKLKDSVHDRPDREPGDHPTCLSCHGGKAHAIHPPNHLSPKQKVAVCSNCHNDAARMARYGLTTGAVSSYEQTFHGKAVMRFARGDAATCTDCHGLHGVLAPNNMDSPTNPAHVTETCRKCHPTGNLNFAMSGANHLRLKIDRSPLLWAEEWFFRFLIFGTMFFLLGMVVLDLRTKVLNPHEGPECGRFISVLIALSFFALVGGIILAFFKVHGAWWAWAAAAVMMVVAFVSYLIQRSKQPRHPEKKYPRMTGILRIQHFLLASSFIVLVLTGFPLHFANGDWVNTILDFFGGLAGARIAHRVAGVVMVVNWIWHLAYLVYRWKQFGFSMKSWTMLPTKKDATDLIDTILYGIGKRNTPPQFDRFQFREKIDYYADMWGTIVMGLSGFILWFPTTIGNRLPDLAFGVSYIAHSYEGLLAMMAIILWHFYNAHFNPDAFPMNPAWLTGTLSESEMAREHPLEKARLDAEEAESAAEEHTEPKRPTKV